MKKKLSYYDDNTPIDKIHLVFLKLEKRLKDRRKIFSDFINSIPDFIEPNNKNEYIFFLPKNQKIILNFKDKNWSYRIDYIDRNNRDEVIDYIINSELKKELGVKFKKLEQLTNSRFFYYIKEVLYSKLDRKLGVDKKYYEDLTELILLNNKKYLFLRRNNNIYYKNELIDLEDKEIINFFS